MLHKDLHSRRYLGRVQRRLDLDQKGASVFQQHKIDLLSSLVPPEFQLHVRLQAGDQLQRRKRFMDAPDVPSLLNAIRS